MKSHPTILRIAALLLALAPLGAHGQNRLEDFPFPITVFTPDNGAAPADSVQRIDETCLITVLPPIKHFEDEESPEADAYFIAMDDWIYYAWELSEVFNGLGVKRETSTNRQRYLSFGLAGGERIVVDTEQRQNGENVEALLYRKGHVPLFLRLIPFENDMRIVENYLLRAERNEKQEPVAAADTLLETKIDDRTLIVTEIPERRQLVYYLLDAERRITDSVEFITHRESIPARRIYDWDGDGAQEIVEVRQYQGQLFSTATDVVYSVADGKLKRIFSMETHELDCTTVNQDGYSVVTRREYSRVRPGVFSVSETKGHVKCGGDTSIPDNAEPLRIISTKRFEITAEETLHEYGLHYGL